MLSFFVKCVLLLGYPFILSSDKFRFKNCCPSGQYSIIGERRLRISSEEIEKSRNYTTLSGADLCVCNACPAGQVPDTGQSTCQYCSPGTYSLAGQSQCLPDQPGTSI
jgi:hypothetical protein